jgi:O-antigen/teichoic acid export membrane protein
VNLEENHNLQASINNKSFFKGTFYVFIIKIFGAGLAFFTQIVLSKYLGIEKYGMLSIFLSIANLLIVLPLMGMDTGIIRSVAGTDDKNQKKWFLNLSFKLSTLLLILVSLFVFTTNGYLFPLFGLDNSLSMYLIIYVLLISYSKILDGFLQGEKKTALASFFSPLSNNFLKLLFLIILFSINNELAKTIVVFLIVEAILLVLRLYLIEKKYRHIKSEKSGNVYDYIKYNLPLFFVASIGVIQLSLDKFILSYMMGNYEVGILRIFENYSSILALFVTPFVTLWPLMSEYYIKNKMDELKNLFKQSTIIISVLILPAWLTLTINTEEILKVFGVTDTTINNIKLIMFLFFLGTVYDAIIGPAGALLNMTKHSKINLMNNLLLLFLNVTLNILLIPKYGLLGAAIAFSSSKILINTLNVIQNKRLFNIFPYGKIHLLLILLTIPMYFIGLKIKEILNIDSIIIIPTMGVILYLFYLTLIAILFKGFFADNIRRFKER